MLRFTCNVSETCSSLLHSGSFPKKFLLVVLYRYDFFIFSTNIHMQFQYKIYFFQGIFLKNHEVQKWGLFLEIFPNLTSRKSDWGPSKAFLPSPLNGIIKTALKCTLSTSSEAQRDCPAAGKALISLIILDFNVRFKWVSDWILVEHGEGPCICAETYKCPACNNL